MTDRDHLEMMCVAEAEAHAAMRQLTDESRRLAV
jgi:hypothetical protein